MLREKYFWQVDAFTDRPLTGNPAAVVFDADDLDADTMQAIAREKNLSETVFLLKSSQTEADCAVRIFTPRSEIPFAGHPTLAAAFALRERNMFPAAAARGRYRLECGIGIIDVESHADGLLMVRQAAPAHEGTDVDPSQLARLLGLPPKAIAGACEVVSTGVRWIIVPLDSVADVQAIRPDLLAITELSRDLSADGLIAFARTAPDAPAYVRLRAFAPIQGISEDPVCGSGNGSVGAYLFRHGSAADRTGLRYRAEQGIELQRPGAIEVEVTDGPNGVEVRVGGLACIAATGSLLVPSPVL